MVLGFLSSKYIGRLVFKNYARGYYDTFSPNAHVFCAIPASVLGTVVYGRL